MFETTHAPSSKFIISLIIVVVVAAIVVAFYFNFLKFRQETETSTGPMPVYAAQGEIIGGFPKELILDEQARVQESYTITYDEHLKQYTVSFQSDLQATTLFNEYKRYFVAQEWVVANETNLTNIKGIYARKGNGEANVVVESGTPRSITITYSVASKPKVVVPNEFPQELILNSEAEVIIGRNGEVEEGKTVYSITLISKETPAELFHNYQQALPAHGWVITKTTTQGRYSIAAAKESVEVYILPIEIEGITRTLINYVIPKVI